MAWQFDGNHSRVGWAVKHYGINVVHGYFTKIDASLDSGGRFLCSVHAAEEVPLDDEDEADL